VYCHEGVYHTCLPTSQGEEGKGWEINLLSTYEELWKTPLPEMYKRRLSGMWYNK
jgi:hypothetical protein